MLRLSLRNLGDLTNIIRYLLSSYLIRTKDYRIFPTNITFGNFLHNFMMSLFIAFRTAHHDPYSVTLAIRDSNSVWNRSIVSSPHLTS
jgi:hypothetical protein